MDLHAEWTTFKNQTIAFRCSVVVFLLALLMGHIATLIWKCWLQPRYRPSACVTSCSCGQLPLSSTDHCSSPERSLLVPKPSSSSSDEKSGPIQTSKDLNGLPANGYPLTHVQIINADCDHACRHTDRCIGLIGLTCGCNQSNIGHSLQQETVTKSLEDWIHQTPFTAITDSHVTWVIARVTRPTQLRLCLQLEANWSLNWVENTASSLLIMAWKASINDDHQPVRSLIISLSTFFVKNICQY